MKHPVPSRPKANHDATVTGPKYRFTVLSEALLRYEWAEDGKFEDRASTFAINRNWPVPEYHVNDNGEEGLEIVTDCFHLSYDKKRLDPAGLVVDVKGKLTLWGAQWRFGDYGRTLGGTARTLDEVDGRCDMGVGVCSRMGFACIDDSKSMLFDGSGWVAGRRPGDREDGYLFAFGHDYKGAIKAYYKLSGSQPLLPRWALGNWWSRYHAYSDKEYLGLMDQFRSEGIPLSVGVLDMDWHLVRDKRVTHSGWTGYTWNDKLFPDPPAFGKEMHKRDLKITLNDHPHSGIHAFEDSYEELAKAIGHDTSHKSPILFDPTNQKFFKGFFEIVHRNVEKAVCDFWWIDWQQGEHSKIPGVDPLWMLNHYQMEDSTRDGQRNIIFSRFAGPGSQRYPVGFSGDTVVSWASLHFQPEFTATASNIGYGWWSHDIGGHMGGGRDDQLVTRWVQYGVFSPLMRLHSTHSAWQSKEPWLFRQESHEIMRDILRFRHRLIPYLYSMNVRAASQGEPLVQPIYWHHSERDEAYAVPNQFYFGTELMVAPITTPRSLRTNLGTVQTWFPPGARYVDIFTGIVYDGNRMLDIYRPLSEYPVFAPEGAIIPLDADAEPKNGGLNPSTYEVLVVVGENGQASVLEDPEDDSADAKAKAPEPNERGSLVQYYQDEGRLTAKVTGRAWTFRFLALSRVALNDIKVLVNDKPHSDAEVSIDPSPPSLVVKLTGLADEKATIDIHLGKGPALDVFDFKARLFALLLDYQIDFSVKDKIWGVVEKEHSALGMSKEGKEEEMPVSVKIGQLLALGLGEEIVGPVVELLIADSRAV